MHSRLSDLHHKEIINIRDGTRLGYVGDVECSLPDGGLTALIVPGKSRFFGVFGRSEEYYIPWSAIRRIGEDLILIDQSVSQRVELRSGRWRFFSLFDGG